MECSLQIRGDFPACPWNGPLVSGFPGLQPPSIMATDSHPAAARRFDWLFLDLNSFFASVEQQLNPTLRGRPVIVVPVETDHTCAIAASHEAKRFGIKTGTMVGEAKRRCPGLVCVLANHEEYVRFHELIKQEVDKHIPIAQVASIDEMACHLPGDYAEEPKALAVARAIKAGLRRNVGECLTCSVGLAPNRFLAKVASDMQKPDGLVLIDRAALPGPLLDLVPRDLPGIGPNMERRLHQLGLRTMRQLWDCSPKQLRAIWRSVEGERLWHRLRGLEIPDEPTERHSIGHSHVLAPELRPVEQAELVARRLVLKVASRLRRGEFLATRMDLSVRIEHGPREALGVQFPPVNDSPALMKELSGLWTELVARTGPLRIKKVSVTVHGLVPLASLRQLELFPSAPPMAGRADQPEARQRLSLAIDALNKKFGRDTVTLGMVPSAARGFSGTKIAFTRVPDTAEFQE